MYYEDTTYPFFHGLSAFRGSLTPMGIINKAAVVSDGVEIAAACKPIGWIGLIVEGETTYLDRQDCWSEVDEHGERYATSSSEYCLWDEYVHYDNIYSFLERWGRNKPMFGSSYCEAFVRHSRILGVWIKPDITSKYRKTGRVLSKRYGVPLYTIPDGTFINDFMDTGYEYALRKLSHINVPKEYYYEY